QMLVRRAAAHADPPRAPRDHRAGAGRRPAAPLIELDHVAHHLMRRLVDPRRAHGDGVADLLHAPGKNLLFHPLPITRTFSASRAPACGHSRASASPRDPEADKRADNAPGGSWKMISAPISDDASAPLTEASSEK